MFVPWLFGCVHLPDEVINPEDERAYHGEESEKVTCVGQFLTSALAQGLQLKPGIDNLSFSASNLTSFVSSVSRLEPLRIFLDTLDLTL